MTFLDDICCRIGLPDAGARELAGARIAQLTMPPRALGRLLELAEGLAALTASSRPSVARKTVVVMAADHGVCAQGVSAFPQAVTAQMVANFVQGGAGINVLARVVGARVVVVDMGVAADLSALVEAGSIIGRKVALGTSDSSLGPAMTRVQALAAVEAGARLAFELAPVTDLFAAGEMGIGNTTAASAITAVLTGQEVEAVTGRGTGIDDAQWRRKVAVIRRMLEVNRPDAADGLEVLATVGGFEIAGLAGLCLGAAALRRPLVIDGFISTAAALAAHAICPRCAPFLIAAHRSVEPGHAAALARLGLQPLLDLGLRLGEGTGAALAFPVVEAAARILSEMATFGEAAVAGRSA